MPNPSCVDSQTRNLVFQEMGTAAIMSYNDNGPARSWDGFLLGVETTREGELVLKYVSQDNPGGFFSFLDETRTDTFTKVDFLQMVALAYGPVLSAGIPSEGSD
ncbi:MAG: hypothetical protein V1820_05730 [archaeon]